MGNVNMEASQINYRGGEKKMSVEEALKNTSGEAAAIAQLQTDVLNLNSNKANQITIAPFFSAEASYDPGDLVYYNGLSYRCVNAHEGEWDADDFAATTISNELDALKSGLMGLGLKYTQLLSQQNIPGEFTSYPCNWNEYDILIIYTTQYGNRTGSIVIPKSWFAGTTSGDRVITKDVVFNKTYYIYKNTDTSVFIQSSSPDASQGVLIAGVGLTNS